ncbi:hypothetical protein [Hoeflea sp.]|uniref:hypothetical protein n=1 Tax=Hoeflea sp. TaxID=1940281 RepID=UPI003B524690
MSANTGLIPSRFEAGRSLAGLFYLTMKRPEGLKLFDVSAEGFWRSFGAFAWAWPVQCFLWTGMWRAAPETRPLGAGEYLGFFMVSTGFDIAAWILPAVLLFVVAQVFGLADKFTRLVVVSNWFGLFSAYIGFFPAALRYLMPLSDGTSALITLVSYVIVIGLYYRVMRIATGGENLVAVFITVMMVMTSLTISELAYAILAG